MGHRGDFNLTPEDLRDAGFLDKLDAQVMLPPDATGRIIDFFVVPRTLAPLVESVEYKKGSI